MQQIVNKTDRGISYMKHRETTMTAKKTFMKDIYNHYKLRQVCMITQFSAHGNNMQKVRTPQVL
jgi:hypothetical protein